MPADRNTKIVTRLFKTEGSSNIDVAMRHGAYSRLAAAFGLTELPAGDGSGTGGSWWVEGLGGETLLEDLVRAASRDPSRLTPIRNLIADLRATEEGRLIVPDALYEIWTVVDQALTTQEAA